MLKSAQPVVKEDRSLRAPSVATAQIPVGARVVAITNANATDNAKMQQVKRARDTFGEENVIDTIDECDGELLKKQKIVTSKGTTIVRDLCVVPR